MNTIVTHNGTVFRKQRIYIRWTPHKRSSTPKGEEADAVNRLLINGFYRFPILSVCPGLNHQLFTNKLEPGFDPSDASVDLTKFCTVQKLVKSTA